MDQRLCTRVPSPFGRGVRGEGGSVGRFRDPALTLALSRRERGRRRGAVLIVILVCLTLATMLLLLLAQAAATEHRASQRHLWTAQAQWIVEAAVERAAARLAADPKYTGETWTITSDELAGDCGGRAKITVEPQGGSATDAFTVRVAVDYPDDPTHRCHRQHATVVELPTADKKLEKTEK
jgi:hypothetical protein